MQTALTALSCCFNHTLLHTPVVVLNGATTCSILPPHQPVMPVIRPDQALCSALPALMCAAGHVSVSAPGSCNGVVVSAMVHLSRQRPGQPTRWSLRPAARAALSPWYMQLPSVPW